MISTLYLLYIYPGEHQQRQREREHPVVLRAVQLHPGHHLQLGQQQVPAFHRFRFRLLHFQQIQQVHQVLDQPLQRDASIPESKGQVEVDTIGAAHNGNPIESKL